MAHPAFDILFEQLESFRVVADGAFEQFLGLVLRGKREHAPGVRVRQGCYKNPARRNAIRGCVCASFRARRAGHRFEICESPSLVGEHAAKAQAKQHK